MRGILLSLIPAILSQTPACKDIVVYRPQNALVEVEEQSHDRWPGCHREDESTMMLGWENGAGSVYRTVVQYLSRVRIDEKC